MAGAAALTGAVWISAAVLLISEDLDEILELSDRIVVMSDGRIVHETPVAAAEVGMIGRHKAAHL